MDNINITIVSFTPATKLVNDTSPSGELKLAITDMNNVPISNIVNTDIYSLVFTHGDGTFADPTVDLPNEITYGTMVFEKLGSNTLEFSFKRGTTYQGSKTITFDVINNPDDKTLPVTKITPDDILNAVFKKGTPFKILNKSTGNVTKEDWTVTFKEKALAQSSLTIVANESMTFTPAEDGKYTVELKNTNSYITSVKNYTSDHMELETAHSKAMGAELIAIIITSCIICVLLILLAVFIILYMTHRIKNKV